MTPDTQIAREAAITKLKSDLLVCAAMGTETAEAAIITDQATVRGVLSELERLATVCREQDLTAQLLVKENQQLRARHP